MQQVKFKAGSMGEARHGNDVNYFLNSIDSSDYAVLECWDDEKKHFVKLCSHIIELEPVVHDVVLPSNDSITIENYKLPIDVIVGGTTLKKGVSIRALLRRLDNQIKYNKNVTPKVSLPDKV